MFVTINRTNMAIKGNFYNLMEIKQVCSLTFKKIKERSEFQKSFKNFVLDNFENIDTYYSNGNVYIDSMNAFRLNQKLNKHHNRKFDFSQLVTNKLDRKDNVVKLEDLDFEKLERKKMKIVDFYSLEGKKLIAIDFEFYEFQTAKVLEAGITEIINNKLDNSQHYIIQENKKYINSKYVPNNRDGFIGDVKAEIPEQELKKILSKYVDEGYVIITFGGSMDQKYINCLLPDKNIECYDIQNQIKFKQESNAQKFSLDRALEAFGVEITDKSLFHNAGNDSIFTAKLFLKHAPEKIINDQALNSNSTPNQAHSNQRKRSITI